MTAIPVRRSDEDLVATSAAGDTVAFAELYDRYADAIFRSAFRRTGDRQIAEEVLQDTFMALWRRAEIFDPRAGSLIAWLSTIARNRSVDRLRHAGRRPAGIPLSAVMGDDPHDARGAERTLAAGTLVGGAHNDDPADVAEDAEQRAEIKAALARIPAAEREVLELAYYGDLTQAEIAQRLGWPLGTVKTRTRRALGRLRESLLIDQSTLTAREVSDGTR